MFELAEAPPTPEAANGLGNFLAIGRRLVQLAQEAGLESHHRVLDVGCGSGRVAAALANVLDRGTYVGIDVDANRIAWAASHIPLDNFRFSVVDVWNGAYGPGASRPLPLRKRWRRSRRTTTARVDGFRFPYPHAEFDFCIATSLYTHLRPDDTALYLQETGRVLKPGGTSFATFFLIDDYAQAAIENGRAEWLKAPWENDTWVADATRPEIAIGYSEGRVGAAHRESELTIQEIRQGSWCGRPDPTDYQDIVISRR